MYTYKQTEPRLWTVYRIDQDGTWTPESDHATPGGAAAHAAYLNSANCGCGDTIAQLQRDIADLRRIVDHLDDRITETRADIGP